ncbi:MAG: hypothetical protein Q8914_07285, partial [Bacteroidota bacterium]|nr:hypothetical protein [Bacteroidota bacterium]
MSLFDNRLKARPSVSGLLMLNLLYVLFCFLTSGYRQGDPVFPLCPWLMFNVSWVLTLMLLGVDFLLLKRNYLKRFIIFIARLAVFTLFSVLFQYLISGLKHLVVDTNFFYSMLILLLMGLVTAYGIDSYLERTDKKLGKYGRRVMLLGGSKNKSLLKSLVQTNSALGCLYISQADLTARQAGTSDDLAAAIKRLNIQFVFTEEQLLSDQLLSVQTCCNRMGVELWLYPAEAPLYKIGFWKSIHRLNVRRAQPIS